MNLASVVKYIENPALITANELDLFRELSQKYPYAQLFHLLYLKSLAASKDIYFEEELTKNAYKITDRYKLYDLVNEPTVYKAPAEVVEVAEVVEEEVEVAEVEEAVEAVEAVEPKEELKSVDKAEELLLTEVNSNALPQTESIEIPVEVSEPSTSDRTNDIELLTSEQQKVDSAEAISNTNEGEKVEVVEEVEVAVNEEEVSAEKEVVSEEVLTEVAEAVEDRTSTETNEVLEDEGLDLGILQSVLDQSYPSILEDEGAIKEKEVPNREQAAEATPLSSEEEQKESTITQTDSTEEEIELQAPIQAVDENQSATRSSNEGTSSNTGTLSTTSKKSFSSWLKVNQTEDSNEAKAEVVGTTEEPITTVDVAVETFTEKETERAEIEQSGKNKFTDLIDKFILTEPKMSKPKKDFYSPEKKAKESVSLETVKYSETLANIIAKQGYFSEAIKAYEQLMLANPEKKIYFAKKIEDLKLKLK